MKKTEAAWLASAIDGEGWIAFKPHIKRRKTPQIMIGVCNTNKDYVEKAGKLLGAMVRVYHHKNKKWLPLYTVAPTNRKKLLPIFLEIFPYLIIKKDKAKRAIEMIRKEI